MPTLTPVLRGCARTLAALGACVTLSSAAHAHNVWMMPSSTVLSSPQWITVDAAVSNDLFYFNHFPLALDNLVVVAPDGQQAEAQNLHRGKLRSVFDLNLDKPGTWRMTVINRGLVASYMLNGERKRWRGKADQLSQIPAEATQVSITESFGRIETFATVGKPSALKASGEGLELLADTHPNDLFSGEQAVFRLAIDGKPAAGVEVTVVPGGTRYRNGLNDQTMKTDQDGRFSVTWPSAGLYWIEAGAEDARTTVPQAGKRRLGYTATVEVLPQ